MIRQGFPETFEELRATVRNSLSAFCLGAAWVVWISQGVEREALPQGALLPGWEPAIFTDDDPQQRENYRKNLYQFLLRGLIRDCGQLVEYFMSHNELVPREKTNGRGREQWSMTPDPIYILRILRNGFNHNWKIGDVYRDVAYLGIEFKQNRDGASPPAGFQREDPLLPRLPEELGGAEVIGGLMNGALDALEELLQ